MADPLSVAGLAFGVVSLGLQISQGITTYIDALNCREQDILAVRNRNDTLQKILQAVETFRSQLERDHHVATDTIRGCLDSCSTELRSLEILVTHLAACDQSTAVWSDKLRAKGKKLLYPFSRLKLAELERRLHSTNTTLQLALQVLGLYVHPFVCAL